MVNGKLISVPSKPEASLFLLERVLENMLFWYIWFMLVELWE